jgi:uncharacterized protein YneF (UPF0154 family)
MIWLLEFVEIQLLLLSLLGVFVSIGVLRRSVRDAPTIQARIIEAVEVRL